ncbi:MAG: type II secretion system major pseudopilin GspG [Akkermansiaceae bacterium]|jgi:general secretion pathway protein G|nr:type II secretion system major pseudopilin GspG [Luteolibacter sp.]
MKIHTLKPVRTSSKGFTLLEIVIVLGIIGVIIAGSIVGLNKIGEGAKVQRVDADFGNLKAAVLSYKMLAGQPPTTQQGLEALFVKPSSPPVPKRWSTAGTKGVPTDPWGAPYRYRNPGKKDTSEFEIYTLGPDGQENTDDDMSSQD